MASQTARPAESEVLDPAKAVEWALLELLAEPHTTIRLGYFVYASTVEADAVTVVAYDARNEVPHHFRLSIEKVDD